MVNPLFVVLYGNLLFAILYNQTNRFSSFNIYVFGSLFLNIALLFILGRMRKLPIYSLIFLMASTLSILNAYEMLGASDLFKVGARYAWFVSSILLLFTLLKENNDKIFELIRQFFVHVSYVILMDYILSFILQERFHSTNEGLDTIILNAVFVKNLTLMALPFLFYSGGKHLFVGSVLFIATLFGTRAGIASGVYILLILSAIYFNSKVSGSRIAKVVTVGVLFVVLVVSALFFVNRVRTVEVNDLRSLYARTAVWFNYLSLLYDNPMGLGPSGGYSVLKERGNKSNLDSSILYKLGGEENIKKRMRILGLGTTVSSEESLYVEFFSSYGLAGIILWLYFVATLFKDFTYAVSNVNKKFTVIYIAFTPVLIYGLLNSFHSGVFFIVFLYIAYFSFRNMGSIRPNMSVT